MLIELISAAAFAVLTWIYFTEDPAPLLGVYAQQGKELLPGFFSLDNHNENA